MEAAWHQGVRVPVAWGDMDAFRHVNNTVYLRWFETARIAFFQSFGLGGPPSETTSNIGPILASISINFRKPLVFPDTIHTTTRVSSLGHSSFVMQHRITSEAFGSVVVADGEGVVVMVDYTSGKAVALPEGIRRHLVQ